MGPGTVSSHTVQSAALRLPGKFRRRQTSFLAVWREGVKAAEPAALHPSLVPARGARPAITVTRRGERVPP